MALKSVLMSLAQISGWIQREQDPTWLFTAPAMQLEKLPGKALLVQAKASLWQCNSQSLAFIVLRKVSEC